MSIEPRQLLVGGQTVTVIRRAIKNLHLGVYPPTGRIRVAAPLSLSDEAIRMAVIGKLGWIKRHQGGFANQPRQSPRSFVGGESHYLWGRRYLMELVSTTGAARVAIRGRTTLQLHLKPDTTLASRGRIIAAFYRQELRTKAEPLVKRWSKRIRVAPSGWGIKRMKTRWGTCNAREHRIWLNLELAKKPVECLEYLVVHELMHLLEPTQNERFISLMDHFLPSWRSRRQLLNSEPLAHETWWY